MRRRLRSSLVFLRFAVIFIPILVSGNIAEAAGNHDLVTAARSQIGATLVYDSAYQQLDYPMGDVPRERGVCIDVVIRALRSLGVDLQVLVHEDMRDSFAIYPALWGIAGPDRNIDHRRVPNLAAFFKREGKALPVSADAADYRPGDIVAWRPASGRPHIGIVSDALAVNGELMIIHNIGWGAREESGLLHPSFPVVSLTATGRLRAPPLHPQVVLDVKGIIGNLASPRAVLSFRLSGEKGYKPAT